MRLENRVEATCAKGGHAIAACERGEADPCNRLAVLCGAVFERARHGIVLLDGITAEVIAANPLYLLLARCGAHDVCGKLLWEIPLFRDLEISRTIPQLLQTRPLVQCEDLLTATTHGMAVILNIVFHTYSADNGRVIQCDIFDATDRKQREVERRRTHTMRALGRMSSRLAEELRRLSPVFAAVGESPGDSLGPVPDELRRARSRLNVLIEELSAFGGARVVQRQPVNLNAVIDSMDGEIRNLLGGSVEFIKLPGPDLAPVGGDEWKIRQMVRKLVRNACAAMPEGGVLRIQTGSGKRSAAIDGEAESDAGEWEWLSVNDSGRRLDAETWSRLFEPFQPASAAEEDCGFGLASVYGIVKQFGGEIAVSSGPQSGTTIRVCFPQAKEEAPRQLLAEPAEPTEPAAETIFILEQEEGLRNVMRNLLSRKGYSVAEARSEAEAWEFLRHAAPARLIVADFASFGSGGTRLACQMAEMHPARKAIFILESESSDDRLTGSGLVTRGAATLVKPFRLEALLAKLREVLGE